MPRRGHSWRQSAPGPDPSAGGDSAVAVEDDDEEGGGTRALWSGILAFGLVSVPVDLLSAVRAGRPGLRMLDREGHLLRRQYYCPEHDRPVARDELVRGYELDDERFVTVSDEELTALEPKKTREIDLSRFVPRAQISPLWIARSYFLAPSGGTTKAYHLLAAAMEKSARAGIATFVMRGKEYLVAIVSDRGLLRADVLRFGEEVRDPAGIAPEGPPSARRAAQIDKAVAQLHATELDLTELEDHAAQKLADVAERKAKRNKDVVEIEDAEAEAPAEAPEGDIIELLKRRLAEAKPANRAKRKKAS